MYLFFITGPYNGTTIVYRMINSSPNVTTMLGTNTRGHAGEGLISLNLDPEWVVKGYLKWKRDPTVPLPMEHIDKMFHSKWDNDKFIKCSKDCSPVVIRWRTWADYWTAKGKCKFICMIRDPRYHRNNFRGWENKAQHIKAALESELDTILIKYEDLYNLEKVKQRLLDWCPELDDLSIDNTSNTTQYATGPIVPRVDPERFTKEKLDAMIQEPELVEYFGYGIDKSVKCKV